MAIATASAPSADQRLGQHRLRLVVADTDRKTVQVLCHQLRRHPVDVIAYEPAATQLRWSEVEANGLWVSAAHTHCVALLHAACTQTGMAVVAAADRDDAVAGSVAMLAGARLCLPQPWRAADAIAVMDDISQGRLAPPSAAIQTGALILDPSTGRVTLHGHRLSVGQPGLDLLRLLMMHAGRPVAIRQLAQLCQMHGATAEAVEIHIGQLRDLLGDTSARPSVIKTVRVGVSYRLHPPFCI
jgi:DNA-binding response OmpR family regulator